MKLAAGLLLTALILPTMGNAQSKAIKFTKLIESFMVQSESKPDWAMGAGEDTPQIIWASSGVESEPDCGIYASCRKGTTRILLNGKEMQRLRHRLEPVPWNLFMASRAPSKWGPELVEISPSCDTVQCSFDFKESMEINAFNLRQICKSGVTYFQKTAYEVQKGSKHVIVVVTDNLGSGGVSTDLSLFFKYPSNLGDLCSEDK
jgi:hypothetical protein